MLRRLALLCGLVVLLGAAAPSPVAQNPPPQDPGVTQRVFQLGGAPTEICPIKPGQTPNVDELKPTIDWDGDAAFGGLTQNFIVHAIANLNVPTAGQYTFRLRSDDGSELFIDNNLVIDHDGLHGATDKDGAVTLTAGRHALRVNFFEAGGDQELRLSWRKPGDSAFSIVPTSVLSADARRARDRAGHQAVRGRASTRPATACRSTASTPPTTSSTCAPPASSRRSRAWSGWATTCSSSPGATTTATRAASPPRARCGSSPASRPPRTPPPSRAPSSPRACKEPHGHQGRRRRDLRLREGPARQAGRRRTPTASTRARRRSPTWPFDGNFHEFAFGLLYKDGFFYLNLSVSINLGGATTVPQGSVDRGTQLKINKDTGAVEYIAGGLRTPHGIGWGPEDSIWTTDNQGGWLPGQQADPRPAGQVLQPLHDRPDRPARPLRQPAPDAARRVDPAQRDRQLAEPADADPERPVRRPDVGRRRDLRRHPARVPREGRGRVPGRLLPHDAGPGVRHHAHGARRTTARSSSAASAPAATGARTGKLDFGLQKLVPNGTQTFDMQKMELADGGFKLTYTKPVSDATLTDLAKPSTQVAPVGLRADLEPTAARRSARRR